MIQDSASSASLCALLAARERATNYVSREQGCGGHLVAYTSNQAHSSIEKAVRVAGLGQQNLRLIDVDETFAMRPEVLEARIEADLAEGLRPETVIKTGSPMQEILGHHLLHLLDKIHPLFMELSHGHLGGHGAVADNGPVGADVNGSGGGRRV